MTLRSRVFETRVYTSSTTPARSFLRLCVSAWCVSRTTHDTETQKRTPYFPLFSRKGLMSSMGIGKMIVEFFSVAISASVCR